MEKIYEKIQELVKKDRITFKKHALLRMHERKIVADEVKTAIYSSEIIESYHEDKPLPSYLLLGYTQQHHRPLHIVVAVDKNEALLWVITVYEPSLTEWEEGFKKRRRR